MKIENVQDFIRQIEDLPTLPDLYFKFREKIDDPKASANDVAKVISSDQAIASAILRVANSAFYGFMRRITNVPHAIVIIGFNGIHHIVLNMTVLNLFKGKNNIGDFNISKIWEHSLATAAIAKVIARKVNYSNLEESFTAGLLHDIGKVIIYKYLPQEFREIIEEVKKSDIRIRDAEEKVIGVDHTDIGSCLLMEWNFPKSLVSAVAYHLNPFLAKENIQIVSIVHLADIISRALEIGDGGDSKIPMICEEAWNSLGMLVEDIEDIVSEVDSELDASSIFREFIR
ncbi:MAG: HDOD domain-containing protein [Candidatus Omnitrophica bacterium]|nr:HDOD domain-containing protein [Candidatus Omnitrophota bacterium]